MRFQTHMFCPINADEWVEEHRAEFAPPIGNKLMHKGSLSVMFVGGPNGRTDFHIDESPEFFFQRKGNMELITVERGERRVVKINEGDVFLLSGRIPHSPQRPDVGSVGLVIERGRLDAESGELEEIDCLRWYTDFHTCAEIEYESYFVCQDLGKDLLPAIEEYKQFKLKGGKFQRPQPLPITHDAETFSPAPFCLTEFVERHKLKLEVGLHIPLFKDHPEKECQIFLSSKPRELVSSNTCEVFVYQVTGSAVFHGKASETHTLEPSSCFVLKQGTKWMAERKYPATSVTLIMYFNPQVKRG